MYCTPGGFGQLSGRESGQINVGEGEKAAAAECGAQADGTEGNEGKTTHKQISDADTGSFMLIK